MCSDADADAASPLRQAIAAAARAASVSQVQTVDASGMDTFSDISALFIAVWGTSQYGPPIPADLLCSIGHAGCNITAAYDQAGLLCGAAVAIVSPGGSSSYSLIAGVLPRMADRGVGFALKQHQRAWALARGLDTMIWTFDPLVSRNARFNLTKLGTHAGEYVPDFYGVLADELNANDESDRLVAVWPLTSDRAIACSEGKKESVELPGFGSRDVRQQGPDGQPAVVEAGGDLWVRVPADIVTLRRRDPAEAQAWRSFSRTALSAAFAAGHSAYGITRSGWYRLVEGGEG